MLKWAIDGRIITGLSANGVELIHPWGVETADSWAFFSLEGNGYRHVIESERTTTTDFSHANELTVRMREGRFRLATQETMESPILIRRSARLECLEDSFFMDFVLRYRFRNDIFERAHLAGKWHSHANQNVYHQYRCEEAVLEGRAGSVSITTESCSAPSAMVPHLYARDARGEWVIHHRMLPAHGDKEVIKLCSRYFKTAPLPGCATRLILSSKPLREALWYRNERKPYQTILGKVFNPNAFPLVRLRRGEVLEWKSRMEFRAAP